MVYRDTLRLQNALSDALRSPAISMAQNDRRAHGAPMQTLFALYLYAIHSRSLWICGRDVKKRRSVDECSHFPSTNISVRPVV
jgi:hypothetical protein